MNTVSIIKSHADLDQKFILFNTINKSGSFKIRLCLDKSNGNLYVVKLLQFGQLDFFGKKNLENEAKNLRSVQHTNVINFHEFRLDGSKNKQEKSKKCNYLVMEYAEKGEMFEYLKLNKGLYVQVARYYFKQLINAVEAIHQKNICHRDIKIDNILLDSNYHLKLADFEFSALIKDDNNLFLKHFDKLGTISYMAPEFYYMKTTSESNNVSGTIHRGDQVDIFACGVVLFTLVYGILPFQYAKIHDSYYKYLYNESTQDKFFIRKELKYINTPLYESTNKLITKMLCPYPEQRATIEQIKNSEFFLGDIPNQDEVNHYMHSIWLMINKKNKKNI